MEKIAFSRLLTGAFYYYFVQVFILVPVLHGTNDKDLKENFKQQMLQQVPRGQQPFPATCTTGR